jgi:hypothetical protein
MKPMEVTMRSALLWVIGVPVSVLIFLNIFNII